MRKILVLEREQGYRNKAVIGGLERFIANWQDEAQQEDPESIRLVEEIVSLLQGYSAVVEREKRRQAVDNVLARLLERQKKREERPSPKPERVAPVAPVKEQPVPGLDASIKRLSGVGIAHARRLERLGVLTVRDLLFLFPRRYVDYTKLKTIDHLHYGEEITVIGVVRETKTQQPKPGLTLVKSIVADSTGAIQATWFNQPFLVRQLRPGRQIALSGRVDEFLGRLVFTSPQWEPLDRGLKELIHTGRLVPVYPLTEGLRPNWLRELVKRTVEYWAEKVPDPLPQAIRKRVGLLDLRTALKQIHFPDSLNSMEEARRRFAFEEFLVIQLAMLRQRREWRKYPAYPIPVDERLLRSFVDSLPFSLTRAQEHVLREIVADLRRPEPMSRLLQGEVGSGKTVVAAAAMLIVAAAGFQAALMVPTEILAEQHYQNISALMEKMKAPVQVRLLTGSTPARERQTIYEEIRSGQANIVIGTHALIQEGVDFARLGFAIVDEQHRFGVAQRGALRQKGYNPHTLVMSATPIPRSLALTIYGDLDISIIDELPPDRQKVRTRWLMPYERERAYQFIRSQVEKGGQAFIICPLVEESEKVEARAATEEYERLQKEIFPDLRLGLLHGRMKGEEKEAVMSAFHRRELDILVSTSVVEVGIDVPNATVMLVEGANRFGLAQLHQFRGRVGRGEHLSYCLLLSDDLDLEETAAQRLRAIEETQDGFVLAEKDLELRGPGEFFGTRQSGLPRLKMARLSDMPLLEKARAEAQTIFHEDPQLEKLEHRFLAEKVAALLSEAADLS